MIKHIHHHIHHQTHLPILGTFSVIVGTVAAVAALVLAFAPNPTKPRYAEAALWETPTCSVIATSTTNNLTIEPLSTTIAGMFYINITAPETYASTANLSSTTCIQIVFFNSTTTRSWYANLGEYGQYDTASQAWKISIPFDSTRLSNDSYYLKIKLLGKYSTVVNQLPYLFNIVNSNTTTTLTTTTEKYGIMNPANGSYFSAAFPMQVSVPSSLPVPNVLRAAKINGAVTMPWTRLPTGSLYSGGVYQFSIPYPPANGEYAYKACPYDINASELYLLEPRAVCSPYITVYANAETTSDSSSTSTVPAPPIIYSPSALNGASLYILPKVIGVGAPGQKAEVQLRPSNSALAAIETKVISTSTVATDYVPAGGFVYVSPNLAPGGYTLSLVSIVNNLRSPATVASFIIKKPEVKITTADQSTWAGEIAVDAASQGYVTGVTFFLRSSASTVDQFLGQASLVSGTAYRWTLKLNSGLYANGEYQIIARAKMVDGNETASPAITVKIANSADVATSTDSSSPTPTADVAPTTTDTADTVVQTDTSTSTATTTTSAVTNANLPVEATATTNSAIKKTTTQNANYVITDAENDPRRAGESAPEKLAIEAVTNLETVQQQATAITLTGFGPPDTKVTLYIFSSPIIVTTKTDSNGNWTYTLDQPLEDGAHEVYVTLTDETGTIEEKSNPLSFFVAEARAVTADDFQRYQDQQSGQNVTYTAYYVALAALLIVLTVILFLYFRVRARHQQLLAKQ